MLSTTISLSNLQDIKSFIGVTTKYHNIPMKLLSDNYNVDAHSIIGIISLDISKPMTLKIDADYSEELFNDLAPFTVTEAVVI